MMQLMANLLGKQVLVECSERAVQAMNALAEPLKVEMELYFSCLLRKAVRFNQPHEMPFSVAVTPKLTLGFRPIATKVCSAEDFEDEPPVTDFPIVKPEAFVPKKLTIDFQRGQWVGEFMLV